MVQEESPIMEIPKISPPVNRNKIESVILSDQDTKKGALETNQDAQKCTNLIKENHEQIDGILVVLPNFGDEKGVADWPHRGPKDYPKGDEWRIIQSIV